MGENLFLFANVTTGFTAEAGEFCVDNQAKSFQIRMPFNLFDLFIY
jgi:hypothetical protein